MRTKLVMCCDKCGHYFDVDQVVYKTTKGHTYLKDNFKIIKPDGDIETFNFCEKCFNDIIGNIQEEIDSCLEDEEEYYRIIEHWKSRIPNAAIATEHIVDFADFGYNKDIGIWILHYGKVIKFYNDKCITKDEVKSFLLESQFIKEVIKGEE